MFVEYRAPFYKPYAAQKLYASRNILPDGGQFLYAISCNPSHSIALRCNVQDVLLHSAVNRIRTWLEIIICWAASRRIPGPIPTQAGQAGSV